MTRINRSKIQKTKTKEYKEMVSCFKQDIFNWARYDIVI